MPQLCFRSSLSRIDSDTAVAMVTKQSLQMESVVPSPDARPCPSSGSAHFEPQKHQPAARECYVPRLKATSYY